MLGRQQANLMKQSGDFVWGRRRNVVIWGYLPTMDRSSEQDVSFAACLVIIRCANQFSVELPPVRHRPKGVLPTPLFLLASSPQ